MNSTDTLKAEDILTPEELAERLKVGLGWVYEKSRARGKHNGTPLPCLRMGRYIRFSWPDVIEWLRSMPSPPPRVRRVPRKKRDSKAVAKRP